MARRLVFNRTMRVAIAVACLRRSRTIWDLEITGPSLAWPLWNGTRAESKGRQHYNGDLGNRLQL
jgi:hypothetical protein